MIIISVSVSVSVTPPLLIIFSPLNITVVIIISVSVSVATPLCDHIKRNHCGMDSYFVILPCVVWYCVVLHDIV